MSNIVVLSFCLFSWVANYQDKFLRSKDRLSLASSANVEQKCEIQVRITITWIPSKEVLHLDVANSLNPETIKK